MHFAHWSKVQAFIAAYALGSVLGLGNVLVNGIRNVGYDGDTIVQLVGYVFGYTLGGGLFACLFLLPVVGIRNLSLRILTRQALARTGGKWNIKEALVFSPVCAFLPASIFLSSDTVMSLSPSLSKFGYALTACLLALLFMAVAVALMTAIRNALFGERTAVGQR